MAQYIAAGFFIDAERLINEFVQVNSVDFSSFSEIWKKRNFSAIYLGRDEKEITPIRITLPQFEIFKKIHIAAKENQYRTLHYVADYLFSNSFDFVASSTLSGPKTSRSKIDYDSATYISSLSRDVKSEITQFHDSRALENLRDLKEKYSNRREKVYPQETHQSTVNEYNEYISQLEDLVNDKSVSSTKHKATSSKAVNDKPMSSTEDKATSSKAESSIGSWRAEIKASAFSKRALFRQLNDSDDEFVPDEKKTQPVVRRHQRKHKQGRKIGRPTKFNLKELFTDSDKINENSASEMELPKITNKRGARKRMTFIEEESFLPTLPRIKLKESTSSSESEDSIFEEAESE